jgi:hypothetical protein
VAKTPAPKVQKRVACTIGAAPDQSVAAPTRQLAASPTGTTARCEPEGEAVPQIHFEGYLAASRSFRAGLISVQGGGVWIPAQHSADPVFAFPVVFVAVA